MREGKSTATKSYRGLPGPSSSNSVDDSGIYEGGMVVISLEAVGAQDRLRRIENLMVVVLLFDME